MELKRNTSKNVAKWLFAGVIMLMIQILLGGITRLTESGLSITEWKPITGILPPLNIAQ
ncbi:MAG: COX15/CtaA family protein, partial [Ginsengibacter sp.]